MRCGELHGSLCHHLRAGGPSLRHLGPLNEKKHPIPGEGLKALWRWNMQSKMRGAETCCWRKSGKSLNCIWGPNCWSSHCLGLDLCHGLALCLGLCHDHGCSFCDRCCHDDCVNGGGCGVSGDRDHLTGSPGCLAGSPCHPCDPSGGGSDGNGT